MIVNMDNVSTMLNCRVTVRRNEQEEYNGVLQEVDGGRAHIKYDDGSGCVWEDINLRKIRRCAPSKLVYNSLYNSLYLCIQKSELLRRLRADTIATA